MVQPVPGERLSSWFDAQALRLDVSRNDLATHLHLDPTLDLDLAADPATLSNLVAATSISATTFEEMTFAAWGGVINQDDNGTALRARRSRNGPFCPACLDESGGRWQMWWRSGFAFACPTHELLLADTCPRCHQEPRQRRPTVNQTPLPTLCGNTQRHPDAERGHVRGSCPGHLPAANRTPLPGQGHVLTAQTLILDLLVSALPANSKSSKLADLDLLARRTLSAVGRGPVTATLLPVLQELPPPPETNFHVLGSQPRNLAVGLSSAVMINTERERGTSPTLQWLVDTVDAATLTTFPYSTYRSLTKVSPDLRGDVMRALDHNLRSADRLRYATPTRSPRKPRHVNITERAANVPAALWPHLALSLGSAPANRPWTCTNLAALTLLPGSLATYDDAATALGGTATRNGMAHLLKVLLQDDPSGRAIDAIVGLHDHLSANPPPIDYNRRRRLTAHTVPFDEAAWTQACHHAGWIPTPRRAAHARRRLWAQLTGGDPHTSTDPTITLSSSTLSTSWHAFNWSLPATAAAELDHQARQFLNYKRLHHEPVTWAPYNWPAGPQQPAITRLDRPRLEHLALNGHKPTDVAETLNVPLNSIRLNVELEPLPWNYTLVDMTRRHRRLPRTGPLDPTNIRSALKAGSTLTSIAIATGISRHTLTVTAKEADLPVRPPGRPATVPFNATWAREQYHDRKRPLTAIARDLGCSPTYLGSLMAAAGIPTRSRGGASHAHPLDGHVNPTEVSTVAWKAFTGPGGRSRAERFVALEGHRTLTAAAHTLGCGQGTLSTQLAALEAAAGEPPIERAERGRPFTYTDRGRTLRTEMRRILAQIAP